MDNFLKRRKETKVNLMFLKSTGFAGRWLQDFIITWQRNLSPSCVAVKIPESEVHAQSVVPQKAVTSLSSSLFRNSDLKLNTDYIREIQDYT